MDRLIGFLIGIFVRGISGMIISAICVMSSESDDPINKGEKYE